MHGKQRLFHECSANPFIAGPGCRGGAGGAGERVDLRHWLSHDDREADAANALPLTEAAPIAFSAPNMAQLADGYDYECMCALRMLAFLVGDVHNKLVEALAASRDLARVRQEMAGAVAAAMWDGVATAGVASVDVVKAVAEGSASAGGVQAAV